MRCFPLFHHNLPVSKTNIVYFITEMRKTILFSLFLAAIAFNNALAASKKEEKEGRVFLNTFTVILSTVTSITTIATTTSCTTSTSSLQTCSVGRRRRGLFFDDDENQGRARRHLFYNDDQDESSSISLPAKRWFNILYYIWQIYFDSSKLKGQ